VKSYAQKPEMSAKKLTKKVIEEIKSRKNYDFVLLNYPNCDLVGHSGDFKATVTAVETVNKCLSDLVPIAQEKGYTIMITADHGNSDFMKYKNGDDCPAHTLNQVIFILVSKEEKNIKLRKDLKTQGLKDIAPTILEIMEIKQPKEMTGKSLIK